jgi:hypothetical protein
MRLYATTAYRPLVPGSDAHLEQLNRYDPRVEARRAYAHRVWALGILDPDKAKDPQVAPEGLSAPRIPMQGTTGVDTKYSR